VRYDYTNGEGAPGGIEKIPADYDCLSEKLAIYVKTLLFPVFAGLIKK